MAEFFGISQAHVAKVVNRLGRLGLVRSTRGVGGGVEIARAPSAIAVGEVVEAFEGDMRLLDCVKAEDEVCAIQSFCKLRGVLGEAERRQMEYLRGVTIEDVLPTVRQLKNGVTARCQATELASNYRFEGDIDDRGKTADIDERAGSFGRSLCGDEHGRRAEVGERQSAAGSATRP